jgi:hypothetical protein
LVFGELCGRELAALHVALVADLKQGLSYVRSSGRIGEDFIGRASPARYNRESSME